MIVSKAFSIAESLQMKKDLLTAKNFYCLDALSWHSINSTFAKDSYFDYDALFSYLSKLNSDKQSSTQSHNKFGEDYKYWEDHEWYYTLTNSEDVKLLSDDDYALACNENYTVVVKLLLMQNNTVDKIDSSSINFGELSQQSDSKLLIHESGNFIEVYFSGQVNASIATEFKMYYKSKSSGLAQLNVIYLNAYYVNKDNNDLADMIYYCPVAKNVVRLYDSNVLTDRLVDEDSVNGDIKYAIKISEQKTETASTDEEQTQEEQGE